jgi:AP-1 complex subunit gamma-1
MEKVPDLAEQFEGRLSSLIGDRNHAVVLGGVSLALELIKLNPSVVLPMLRRTLVPSLVRLLQGLLGGATGYSLEYDVSGLNDPFLQVQVLRLLRVLGRGDVEASDLMVDVLTQLAAGLDGSRNVGQAVLYEGLLTIFSIRADASLRTMAVGLLARLLTQQGTDHNLRYVSLNLLNKVLLQQTPGTIEVIERHRETVLRCLDDPDVSIRHRAADVALALVSRSSIRETFARLEASVLGPGADAELATALVPRLAVLAARFAPNSRWYVDTLRSLLGHTAVSSKEELVSTFVRIINNTEDVQAYATKTFLETEAASEGLIQAAAWCLGEHGHRIDAPAGQVVARLLAWLKTPGLSSQTMAYVITALGKLSVRFPAALGEIQTGLRIASQRRSDEAAQKAAETLALVSNAALRSLVFAPIPADPKYTIGSDDVMATGQLLGVASSSALDRSESPAPVLDVFAELATLSLDGLGSPSSRAPSSARDAPFASALASPKQDYGKMCYDSHGLQLFLRPVTENAPADALHIQLTAYNKLAAPIAGLQVLAAVPKSLRVLLDPASGTQIAPSATVRQLLRVTHATSDEPASTILSMLKLRLRLSFAPPLSGQAITETIEVSSIL